MLTGGIKVTAVGAVTEKVVCTTLVSVQPATDPAVAVSVTAKPDGGQVALGALEQVIVALVPEGTAERQERRHG